MKAVIGIDAGHGGSSSGTYTVNTVTDGLFEKDFALEQALLVEKHLLRNGFEVVMTRRTDADPGSVNRRAEIVAEGKADFALSIHFNGFGSKSANGAEVYVPHGEKFAGIESGFYDVLGELFKIRRPFARSSDFSDRNGIFDKRLNRETKRFDAVSKKKDYFGFIRSCWEKGISADLLEICFLTNPEDFEKYCENRNEIAEGIAKSIVEGFGEEFVPEKTEEILAKPKIVFSPRLRKNKTDMPK